MVIESSNKGVSEMATKRPRLHWSNPGPHPGNCNCTYCHHINNCDARLHDDGGKNCRAEGLGVNYGLPTVWTKSMYSSIKEYIEKLGYVFDPETGEHVLPAWFDRG